MLRTGMAGFVGVLVGAALVGVAVSQQEGLVPDTTEAQRFVVRDAQGTVRIWLGPIQGENPGLSLYDEIGQRRALLWLTKSGAPCLWLSDADGKRRMLLEVSSDGGVPAVRLCDSDGQSRAALALLADQNPCLGMTHKNRELCAGMGFEEGQPMLELRDEDGNSLWRAP
ncbi:MAG: hypothetical protein ACE5JM_11095 [Armatimonadota bacterium]